MVSQCSPILLNRSPTLDCISDGAIVPRIIRAYAVLKFGGFCLLVGFAKMGLGFIQSAVANDITVYRTEILNDRPILKLTDSADAIVR